MNAPSPFEPRVVAGLTAAMVALFAASLLLTSTGGGGRRNNRDLAGANSYSRSAVGHLGFFDVLQKLDYRTLRGEHDVLAQLGTNGILILAEPSSAISASASRLKPNGTACSVRKSRSKNRSLNSTVLCKFAPRSSQPSIRSWKRSVILSRTIYAHHSARSMASIRRSWKITAKYYPMRPRTFFSARAWPASSCGADGN